MIRDNYLDISKIIRDKKILKLFRAVEEHGGALRFVGGSVRDALSGIDGFDLDLATDLSPEELVEACSEKSLKTVPIGIKFGTVGVVIDNNVLEVTSLRKDVKTDGRHAEVEFTTDWEIDASRRDLTINAVYADEKGNVFDYYNGIDDLEKGIVRFIGSPSQRIKEDYLRILRFFRFHSIFAKTPIDQKALIACAENKDGLKNLSMERIRDELFKIFLTENAVNTLKIMGENDILGYVLPNPSPESFERLEFLMDIVKKHNLQPSALRRLFILYLPDAALASNMAARMKFSKKQKLNFLTWAETDFIPEDFADRERLTRLIYLYGKEFAIDKLFLVQAVAQKEQSNTPEIIRFIEDMIMPVFPIRGKDILDVGISDNRLIGDILKKLEQIWMNNGFRLTRDELLKRISDLSGN